jgi:hypothetical protein
MQIMQSFNRVLTICKVNVMNKMPRLQDEQEQ